MKKFVFTLERMLAYQEQNLEKEKGILARITAERDKLEEDRRDKELRIRHIQEDIGQRQIQGTTVFILKGCYSVLEGARIRLEEIETELARTQARVEKQRHVVTEASQEVKKLEKLKHGNVEHLFRRSRKRYRKNRWRNTAMKRQRSSRILLSSMLQEHLSGMAFPK